MHSDEKDEDEEITQVPQVPTSLPEATSSSKPSYKVTMDELLDSLPATISYTPFSHPSLPSPLLRRDLFDARFQLISQDQDQEEVGGKGKGKENGDAKGKGKEEFVDAATDLIPGLYEGGLKTWEGGVDLVEVLSEGLAGGSDWLKGKSVLEVGCGTALPSCYLLHTLLSTSSKGRIHLQDFNLLVLQLVTLPNLLLSALPFLAPETEISPGHLDITDEIKESFKLLLGKQGVDLEFSYGHWAGLAQDVGGYDLVLTAETIYAEESVDDLLSVLKASTRSEGGSVENGMDKMSMQDKGNWTEDIRSETVILVAAKMAERTDPPEVTQPTPASRTPPTAPTQIPTRGGNRAATDPSAPGVNRSSTLGWLREMMARAPTDQPPPQPQLQPTPTVKPSRSDLSAATPSMFVGATSRRASGQLQTLSLDPETETSLINPSASSPNVPVPTPPTESPVPSDGFRFPTTDTGISVPTTVIPAMLSGVSIQTSSGVSTIRQDPDETVSSTYFPRPPRRYRSDADVVNNAPSDEDSEDVSYDDIEDRLDIEDSPDVEPLVDQRQGPTVSNRPNDIYLDMMFRDSLSELAIDIERNRLARRIVARREEDEQGTARARHATLARAQRDEEVGPLLDCEMPGQSVHFKEPLLPVAVPVAPQPIKWAKGFQKGISRLFGREPRATPDLELGDQRIPYAQKGKGKAIPPPPKVKPNRDSPTTSLLQRLKGKPVLCGDFLDMSSDHGSPLQLPNMPSIAGVTRKLSFRRQPQSPMLDMGSDPFARDPLRLTEYDQKPVRTTESAPPSRLSTVYERAARALTIKKRPVPARFVYDPNMSKAEQILGMDLSSYKATQSYPDSLQPIPRHHKHQASNPNLRGARPATSSGLRSNDLRGPTQPRPISFSPTTSLRVPSQPRPTSFAGNHPFYTAGLSPREPLPKPLPPREPLSRPLPPREPLSKTTEAVKKDLGKWLKGLSRPSTADGTRRTSWAPINPGAGVPDWRRSTSDRRASVGSGAESVANRLERMVSDSSSQLEPTRLSSTNQLETRPARLYPGGIDPIADPELYRIVQRFELHRRAEDERRAGERRDSESPGLHISATSFPMPPTPRQVPVRRSSLPRQPVPTSPRLLSPSAMPRPWRTPSPVHSLQVVQEDSPEALVLGPLLPAPHRPTPIAASTAPSPARVESSPGALAGYEALSPVHPIPQTTPNVLGLSTAPSTSTSSRVSFAPSPPRHSHVDLKEFLMTSPSQINRTTSAAEFRRPVETGPLIPDYPASYRELEPYILSESDVVKRQDQEYSSSEDFDIWPPEPRYTWKSYRMVLTSAQRGLDQNIRSHDLPPDVETEVCIHLFKIRPRSRPATAPGSKMPATPAKYDPEVTRRVIGSTTVIFTYQPYTVTRRQSHGGHIWKDEDNEVDVTEVSDASEGNAERVWHLILPSLYVYISCSADDRDAFDSWSYIVNRERDCLVAGQLGCGITFRDHIDRGLYPTAKARQALLHRELTAAQARWSTRLLPDPDQSPPHSPIRPAPKIPPGTPSNSILKKRASTGDIRSTRPDIGPASQMQGYIDGLQAFETAYDEERQLREERYRAEGLYDDVPRIRTVTDSTIRPDQGGQTSREEAVRPAQEQAGSTPTRLEQAQPELTRSERIAQPGPFARPSPTRPPPDRSIPIRSAPIRTSSRPYASTSQLDDSSITRVSRHRGQARESQTLSPLEPTPALSDVSLPSTQEVQSPDDFITILPRRRRPKSAIARRPVPLEQGSGPPDGPESTRSYQDDSPDDGLNEFVNAFVASLEEHVDTGDTDLINSSNPPSPAQPRCADPTTPPRPPRPGSWLDVSKPSTFLPIHFSHLPITIDRDPPIFGSEWPFAHRHPIKVYQNISREATAYLSSCAYVKTVKSLDDLRARNAQMEMIKAGGPLGMKSAGVDQVFVFIKPTGSRGEEKAVPMEEVLGLLDATAESATLALQDMNAEDRRIAKGKEKETSAERLAWMKSVVDGMRDQGVSQKENLPPNETDRVPKGKEVNSTVNLARMTNLMKRLKGREVAQKENNRRVRLVLTKKSEKENIPLNGEEGSLEVKKEIFDIGKGKGKETGKSGITDGDDKGTDAQSKPVTPPKAKLEGPSSIRSTRSTLSLRSTRSAAKATKAYQSPADPTLENLSSDKMPNPTLSSASYINRDLQDVRQSHLRLGSTPSVPQTTARVLYFDDTPDHSIIHTPFTNMSTIETPDEGTPTHGRAMRNKLRNQKRASEEELQNEAKRVKDVEAREKAGGKIEAWSAAKTVEGGKKNEAVVLKGEEDVFGNGGE